MVCIKCGYQDDKETILFGRPFCKICALFLPNEKRQVKKYAKEKIDWKLLETFRKQTPSRTKNQIQGMQSSAENGKIVTRPPLGYDVKNGNLIPNEKALVVHRIFVDKKKSKLSLNALAKKYNLSVNGVKKILSNRTYLGEIKFQGKTYKGNHKAIIDVDLFRLQGY